MKFGLKPLAAALLVAGFGGALAVEVAIAADPIAERQQLMKTIARSRKAAADMAAGKADFDAAAAAAALQTVSDSAKTFPTLFPAGSDTGETEAAPAIWTDNAEFQRLAMLLSSEAGAAAAAKPQDPEALAAAMKGIGGVCRDCHDKFRIEKK